MLAQKTLLTNSPVKGRIYDREVGVRVPLAADVRATTVGQLLFAPSAWVYSTLHPFRVGKSSTGLRGWG